MPLQFKPPSPLPFKYVPNVPCPKFLFGKKREKLHLNRFCVLKKTCSPSELFCKSLSSLKNVLKHSTPLIFQSWRKKKKLLSEAESISMMFTRLRILINEFSHLHVCFEILHDFFFDGLFAEYRKSTYFRCRNFYLKCIHYSCNLKTLAN